MTSKTIPFVDLVSQYQNHKDEIDRAVQSVLDSAAFVGGPHVASFERNFAEYCGRTQCVGVANGTDALHLTLRALGIGPGDEVVLPVHTFIATAEAVSIAGARPVFVDVDDDFCLMQPESLAEKIGPKTKAIIPVHLYGQLVNMESILAIAREHQLAVIEDAAQAHGARLQGQRAGSFGAASCFSFYPGKNLGAYGDGGAVVTDNEELVARLRELQNHGRSEKGHTVVGFNSRLDGLQAAVLNVKLKHLDAWTKARQEAAANYDKLLANIDGIRLPQARRREGHVYHLYVVRSQHRDALRAHLAEQGIQTGIHYAEPLHLTHAYEKLGHRAGDFPVAEKLAQEILSLPMYAELTSSQQERIANAIKSFAGARR